MKKLSSAKQQEIASAQWDRYERARDNGHLDYIEMAKKCDAYYQGEQWGRIRQNVARIRGSSSSYYQYRSSYY